VNGNPAHALFMRRKDVAAELGVSRGTLARMLKSDPTFPRFVSLTPGIEVIDRRDFEAWLVAQRARSRASELLRAR